MKVVTEEDLESLKLTPWKELSSDEAISQFTFAGLAAHRTHKVVVPGAPDIAFESSWSWVHGLEHRAGYEQYGATAYFDANATLLKIFWDTAGKDIFPVDPDWEHAKWVYKSSVLVGTTVKDHLIGVHFLCSNGMATSAVTNLNPKHPIRRLVKPHTYSAASINRAAVATLATEYSFVHRATSLTWKGMATAFHSSYDELHFEDITKHLKSLQMDDADPEIYPFGHDMSRFVAIVAKHVASYVDVYYVDDDAVHDDEEVHAFIRGLRTRNDKRLQRHMLTKEMLCTVLTHQISYVSDRISSLYSRRWCSIGSHVCCVSLHP
jgi:hypothetical protein